MTTITDDSFDDLNRNRSRAVTALRSLAQAATELRFERQARELRDMSAQVANDRFRLTFVGGFDAGKSTLINALLGERLLPTGFTPVTAALTVIRHGPQREAWLVRGGNHGQRERVPIEALGRYLRIDDDVATPDPVVRVEIALPSELLRNGIEIVDTPGLDDALANGRARTDKVVAYLPNTDAVVFVTQLGGAMNARERGFVNDTLHPLGLRDMFIACTRADELLSLPEDERDYTVRKIRFSVADLVPGERVFFVNGASAFQARLAGAVGVFAASGVPHLDQCLRRFLSKERGALKLGRAVGVGLDASSDLAAVVEARRKTLGDAAERDRENAEQVIRTLPILRRQRDSILATVDGMAALIRPEAEAKARDFLLEIAERCPEWLADLPAHAKVRFREVHKVKQRAETVATAVTQHFGDHLKLEIGRWHQDRLGPFLRDRGAHLQTSAEEEIVELFELSARALRTLDYLDEAEAEVTPELLARYFVDLGRRDALAGAGGPGVPDVIRTLIARGMVLVAVAVLTAGFRLAGSLLALGQALVRVIIPGQFEQFVAALAAQRIAADFRANAPEWGGEVGAAVAEGFKDVRTKLQQGLDNRITDVEERVESRIALLEGNQTAENERLGRAEDMIRVARSLIDGGQS